MAANTRPYTREELKSLRRANLQNLFKIHNLKGANGTNSILIDTLVEYFTSPTYVSLHPPVPPEKEKPTNLSLSRSSRPGSAQGLAQNGKVESRFKGPTRPVRGRVASGPVRKAKEVERNAIPGPSTTAKPIKRKGRPDADVTPPSKQGGKEGKIEAEPRRIGEGEEARMDEKEGETDVATELWSSTAGPSSVQTSSSSIHLPPSSAPQQPTPPVSSSTSPNVISIPQSNQQGITLPHVEALLQANDAQWQARLDELERNLNEQVERLRMEMAELRKWLPNAPAVSSAVAPAGPSSAVAVAERTSLGTQTWSPWEGRSVSGPAGTSQPHQQTTLPFPILGKRRHPHLIPSHSVGVGTPTSTTAESELDRERGEAKRVRFNGSRPEDLTSVELPPVFGGGAGAGSAAVPRTPSPQKSSAAFGSDYFSRPGGGLVTPGAGAGATTATRGSSLIPRTPSPSRQGTVPDNSQTPRLPADWQFERDTDHERMDDSDDDLDDGLEDEARTPDGVGIMPQFATTPEPPHRPISPTIIRERSISASSASASDRLTPGRMMMPSSAPAPSDPTPTSHSDDKRISEGIPLSTVTDLERIDETDESHSANVSKSTPQHQHQQQHQTHISPGGQLRFPTIKPTPRLSGLGMPGSASKSTPSSQAHGHQRKPSLLAPPALISRNSRAGSELPSIRIRSRSASRGLSPPPRPSSANAIHGASTPPRTMFPLNLPETGGERIRSASADYMHVAMHGLEDDLDFDDRSLSQLRPGPGTEGGDGGALLQIDEYPHTSDGFTPRSGTGRSRIVSAGPAHGAASRSGGGGGARDVPTPSHRTLLGTERYNDKRFGDIPVGYGYAPSTPSMGLGMAVWDTPKVDLGGPETPS